MSKSSLENIYYKLFADERDSEEVMFYYDALYENIMLFADPKHKDDVENHFYGIVCGLCRAEAVQGFKLGFAHAIQLAVECTAPSALSRDQAKSEYEEMYKEQARRWERLRADTATTAGAGAL